MAKESLPRDAHPVTPQTSSPDFDNSTIQDIFRRSRVGSAKVPIIKQPKGPHYKTADRYKVPLGREIHANAERAIVNGDLQLLLDQIDKGIQADAIYPDGSTLLHFAAARGKAGFLRVFLAHGYDVDLLDDHNEGSCTPLYWAARYCHIEAMKVLIDNGADVNTRACLTFSPLTAILRDADKLGNHHKEAIELLLYNGVNINECWRIGKNPGKRSERLIEQLVSLRRISTIRRLINHGANLECTLWHAASYCKNKQAKIVKLLMDNGARDSHGNPALLQAIFRNKPDIAREILKYEKQPLGSGLRARIRRAAQANRRRTRKMLAKYGIYIDMTEPSIGRGRDNDWPNEPDCIEWPMGDFNQLFNDPFCTEDLTPSAVPQARTMNAFESLVNTADFPKTASTNKQIRLPTPEATPTPTVNKNPVDGIRCAKALPLAAAQAASRKAGALSSINPAEYAQHASTEPLTARHKPHSADLCATQPVSASIERPVMRKRPSGVATREYSIAASSSTPSSPVMDATEEDVLVHNTTCELLNIETAQSLGSNTTTDLEIISIASSTPPPSTIMDATKENVSVGNKTTCEPSYASSSLGPAQDLDSNAPTNLAMKGTERLPPIRIWVKGRCFDDGNRHLA